MKLTVSRIAAVLLLLGVATQRVHGQSRVMCSKILKDAGGDSVFVEPCNTLAHKIVFENTRVSDAAAAMLEPDAARVSAIFSQRDMQFRQPQKASLAGTPAQGQAIPSVQPAGVAAGTIALVGTKAGDDAIAAIGLNPAMLFLADEASQSVAQYSRLADISIFVPATGQAMTSAPGSTDTKLKYFGVRVRFNASAFASGTQVWDGAKVAIGRFMTAQDRAVTGVLDMLKTATDPAACATALLANGTDGAVKDACGKTLSFDFSAAEAEAARRELAAVRRAADASYFGADIRVDVGDPTLGATPNAAGRFLFAGLAAGRRFGTDGTTLGLQLRAGLRHARLDSDTIAEFAAEGGIGFELARTIDDQELGASLAIEGRHGGAPANGTDRFQTNFAMIRATLSLPVTVGNSVSINAGIPISGPVTPTLSVNFNWGMLLSDSRKSK